MHASRAARFILIVGFALTLTGCTTAGGEPQAAPTMAPTVEPSSTPSETPEPTVNPVDPGDMTTWAITTDGIGPVQRGADSVQIVDALAAFEANEMCPGIVGLQRDASAEIVMSLAADGHVSKVWVTAWGNDGSASPMTEAGIRLGSSMEELTAAYPDLSTVVQRGADTWVYSVQPDPQGMIDFVVEDEVVVLIGASDSSMTPKEWCS